jgi:hypothetical protein
MGIRGELFSTRVGCEGRTYFFNVKENRMGDMFLTVVESKPSETEGFERRSVVIFRDDLADFLKAFQGALDFMRKDEDSKLALNYKGVASVKHERTRVPSGFAPSPSSPGPDGEAPRKRRIVVRKKSSSPADKKTKSEE